MRSLEDRGLDPAATSGTGRRDTFLVPALALTHRGIRDLWRQPVLVGTSLVVPCIMVGSLSGIFTNLSMVPGFPTSSMLSWFLPLAVVEAATLAGTGCAIAVAHDMESGFMHRVLLTRASRASLLVSTVLVLAVRALVPIALVLVVGFAAGVHMPKGPVAIALLIGAAIGFGAVVALGCVALTFRMPSHRIGLLTQALVLALVLLSTSFIPLDLMHGWLRAAALVNPMTAVLGMARAGFLEGANMTEISNGSIAICVGLLVTWFAAMHELRTASEV